MKERKEINVNTREEFINLLRSEFIPSCNRMFGKGEHFNIGYAIRNWTSFWYHDQNDVFISVNLIS